MLERHPDEQDNEGEKDKFDFDEQSVGSDEESVEDIKESNIFQIIIVGHSELYF